MSCSTVCRICLAVDARTFLLTGTPLQGVFEKLTSIALHTDDQRPVAACYICYHLLKKSYKLTQTSAKAENVLTDIFKRCNMITKQSVSLAISNAKSLCNYLSITNVDYYDTTLPKKRYNDLNIVIKLEKEDEEENNIETEEIDLGADVDIEDDLEDLMPLSSVKKHHTADIKEEQPDDGTFLDITKTQVQEKTEKRLIPKVSKSQRRYKCDICPNTFITRSHLKRHLMMHSDEKPFKCHICDSQFRTKTIWARHLMTVHKVSNPISYKCDTCGREFKDRRTFWNHRKSHVYECDICHKKINTKNDFANHWRTHTGERFKCNICQRTFTQKSTLSYHLKKVHIERKLIKCEFCDVMLTNSKLKAHTKIHKKIECDVCHQTFKKIYLLTEHVRTHTGERPFECNECHKTFRTKPNLRQHLLWHSGTKRYKCKFCPSKFLKKYELSSHMRTHTGEKPYECSVCQNRFRFRHILIVHMRTHTGEKPYQCHICEKKFSERGSMTKHVSKIHNKNKIVVNTN